MEERVQTPTLGDNGKIPQEDNEISPVSTDGETRATDSALSTPDQAPSTTAPDATGAPRLNTISAAAHTHSPTDGPRSPSYAPCQTTILELVSIGASSSAFPESFGLNVSPKGRWITAYSSAALYLFLAEGLPLFKDTCRAFRLRRKPLAVAITDVGKFAVLTSSHKIDVYRCGDGSQQTLMGTNQKLQTVLLNNEARGLELSVSGDMIAAASEYGVEIISLGLGLGPGSDRRQINCGSADAVAFSDDEKCLLVTSAARRSKVSTHISLSSSFEDALFEDENAEQQPVGRLWISQLLFPEKLNARQSVFLPDPSNGQVSELLAYDSKSGRFGIFDVALKQFTGKTLGPPEDIPWLRSDRYDDTLPGVSSTSSHVATAVVLKDYSEIWTYRLPDVWRDATSTSSSAGEDERGPGLVPLQRLKLPQREENSPETISSLRWLQIPNAPIERLIALVSRATVAMPEHVVSTAAPGASGRLVVFDFKRSSGNLYSRDPKTMTIDLDEFPLTEKLADEEMELEREVDIVRRRTQVQRTQGQRPRDLTARSSSRDNPIRKSSSTSSRNGGLGPSTPDSDPNSSRPRRRRSFSSMSDMSEDTESGIPVAAVDEPYSHSAPRSQFTLTRAATVSQEAGRLHLRAFPDRPLEYRRADGLRQVPHESDADNWVPPPPPYSELPDPPGPNAISLPITAFPGAATAVLSGASVPPVPTVTSQRSQTSQGTELASRTPGSQIRTDQTVQTGNSLTRNISRHLPQAILPAIIHPGQVANIRRREIPGPTTDGPIPSPGSLNSSMTFPLVRPRSSRGNSAQLSIPQTHFSGSASAPVSPADAFQTSPSDIDVPRLDQVTRLHRRSDSGESAPRAAVGATRHISSLEMMPQQPPPDSAGRYHSSTLAHSSRRATPTVTRLTTIPSVSSQESEHGPIPWQDYGETPETPTGRSRWRRVATPTRPSGESPVTPASGTSRPIHYYVNTPSTPSKPKEQGPRCIVQ